MKLRRLLGRASRYNFSLSTLPLIDLFFAGKEQPKFPDWL
jgi:hypothetical protein